MWKKRTRLIPLLMVLGLMGAAEATYDTVGVYDPDDEPHHNQVDQSGTYSSHTGDAGPENVIDLATFQALIGPAFNANAGGVVNLENANGSLDGQDIIAKFGVSKAKSLTLSNISGIINTGSSVKNGRTPISGTGRLAKTDTANFAFAIGPLTGGKAGEAVTYFGGSLLGRDEANLAPQVTATFSGGGTVTAVATMSGVGPGLDQDTFFGFVAPPGQSIVSVDFNPTGGPYTNMDDVAFITSAFVVVSREASRPSPGKGQADVPRDAVLSWAPGGFAKTHDVYFGTAFADVNSASRTSPKGVLAGQGQEAATYDPPGLLAFGQTYYWRVDEVNAAPGTVIYKGGVWSFTTEPYAYALQPVAATASSSDAGAGPENTIDGSGLTNGLHSTANTAQWLSDKTGPQPTWIQYAFDGVHKLYEMRVWNYNVAFELILGFGFKDVTIEYSTDGTTWTLLRETQFARAPGQDGYAANTTVSLAGAVARFVRLTAKNNWGGVAPQFGLSEVQFSYIPVEPRQPVPASGVTGVDVNAALSWRAGREAASHTVYFGTDAQTVTDGTAAAQSVTDSSFSPGALALGTTYYWRVDEVNAVTYPGDVWSFTSEAYKVVDDFESYTDQADEEVFAAWDDGFDNPARNGAVVGLATAVNATFCDTTSFHGGRQSMPFAYDNTAALLSEATLTLAPARDWSASGIQSLELWFQGADGNTGQLYVKINNTKVPYNGNVGDIAKTAWQRWSIDLSAVAGGVSKVTQLTIGVEGAGAAGTLRIDDIRLYPTVLAPITQPVITKVVRANGQIGTRTDASPITTYIGSTAPAGMPTYGLTDDATVFSDRPYPWSMTPAELLGVEYVLTFNSDKNAGETDVTYTVTLSRAATVYLTCDDRIADQQAAVDLVVAAFAKPGQFQDTGLTLYIHENATTDRPMSVFAADLPAGTYGFGAQDSGNNFYTILVKGK